MYDIEIKMIKSKTKSSQIKKLIESENNKIERTTSKGLDYCLTQMFSKKQKTKNKDHKYITYLSLSEVNRAKRRTTTLNC